MSQFPGFPKETEAFSREGMILGLDAVPREGSFKAFPGSPREKNEGKSSPATWMMEKRTAR
ncbi:MAG: hypothetical protein ACP5HQ_03270 [Thermoprotei archaeon]